MITTAHAAVEGDRILVRTPYSPESVERCRSVGGARWDKAQRAWGYPATATVAAAIRQVWSRTAGGPGLTADAGFRGLLAQAPDLAAAAIHKTATDLAPIPHLNKPGWMHQRQAYWFARDLPAAMLAIAMGTGKSAVAVGLACVAGPGHTPARLTLILCPLSVVTTWAGSDGRPGQFAQHTAIPFRVLALGNGYKSVAAKVAATRIAAATSKSSQQPLVVVVGYESARESVFADWAAQQQWDLLVLDESHRLKAPGGVTARLAMRLAGRAAKKLALTGTPMPHGPLDVYAQYRALDPTIFGTNYAAFRSKYGELGGYMGKQVVGYRDQEGLNERFYRIAYRVGKDVLDLPPFHHITRTFTLGAKAQRAYAQLENDLVADVGAGKVTAANALVRLLRLAQLVDGFLPLDTPDEDGARQLERMDTGKGDLLEDVLTDLPVSEPVVVFARFWPALDLIHATAAKLGRRSLELSGRRRELERWQNGEAPILVVQLQSGGAGIDLTRAAYAVYFDKSYSLGDYDQSLARVHRPGQQRPTTYIHLVAQGTVDEAVQRALDERREVVAAVLDMLAESRLSGAGMLS